MMAKNPMDQVAAAAKKLFDLVDKNDELSVAVFATIPTDDDEINAFSGYNGDRSAITEALYVDLVDQLEKGEYEFFKDMCAMVTAVMKAAVDMGLDPPTVFGGDDSTLSHLVTMH